MASKKIEKIRLRSTGLNEKGKPTGYYLTTTKNRTNTPDKLEKKKFDPVALYKNEEEYKNRKQNDMDEAKRKRGMYVLFKETKIK